jgi:guanine nucleotide-binding protein subunit alpha
MKNATDPLTLAMAPPPAETPAQRIERENKEHKAREISWRIDEEIRAERVASKKRKKPVKVLVIGQSESGASSTIVQRNHQE